MIAPSHRETAVVIAAHGDRAGAAPNRLLLAHAAALAARQAFAHVSAGVLKGEPVVEDALAAAAASGAARIALFPLFMASGYFTDKVLPQRITEARVDLPVDVLAPLGADPQVADLLLARAAATVHDARWAMAETRLLVVGHGSKLGPASANATRRAARRMLARSGFAAVDVALLEEPPFLHDALAETGRQTVVAGFFSGDGLHAGEDVPGAIRDTRANALYAGSAGTLEAIPALIEAAVRARFA